MRTAITFSPARQSMFFTQFAGWRIWSSKPRTRTLTTRWPARPSEEPALLEAEMFTRDRRLAYVAGNGRQKRLIEIRIIGVCGEGKRDLLMENVADGRLLVRQKFLRRKWILR